MNKNEKSGINQDVGGSSSSSSSSSGGDVDGNDNGDNNNNNNGMNNQSRFSQQIAYNTFQKHLLQNNSASKKKAKDEYADTFLRKTTKFWVLPSNCLTVKKRVSKHIPEWRFDNKVIKNMAESGSMIHSIYFDTRHFDLYDYRILQEEDSMLFRYRWYNNEKASKGYFEQKLRQPAWRSLPSIKQRFQLAPNLVLPYLENGPKAIPQQPTPLMETIYNDTCKWPSQLKHCIRSSYRRTVFQESNGAAVRVSFDEDITLLDVKTSSWEEACDPLFPLPPHKIFSFPIAVLEIKLAFDEQDEVKELNMPEWVLDMERAELIIEVEKFSKFCTGAAVLNLHSIRRIPSWIPIVKAILEFELASKSRDWFGIQRDIEAEKYTKSLISIPEKVEPRVFLSNERTLLKWVRMCFLGIFVGLALVNFQHAPVIGFLLTLAALIVLLRSYYMYHYRMKMIQNKDFTKHITDNWGPTLVVILFIIPAISYVLYSLGIFS